MILSDQEDRITEQLDVVPVSACSRDSLGSRPTPVMYVISAARIFPTHAGDLISVVVERSELPQDDDDEKVRLTYREPVLRQRGKLFQGPPTAKGVVI